MKALVLGGAGKMGIAAAWDLAKDDSIETIGIADMSPEAMEKAQCRIPGGKVRTHSLDVTDRSETVKTIKEYDVCIIALPNRKASYKAIEAAIQAGVNTVDILEEYHRRPDLYEIEGLEIPAGLCLEDYGEWLHQQAIQNEVLILDGMGFAPGLSNITLADGVNKMDKVVSAIARVGGIPSKETALRHPLKYVITWAFEHVLREYNVKTKVIKKGGITEVDPLTDREDFLFAQLGKQEMLECAITPGMPSFIYTYPEVYEFAEKTVRWPGHYQGIDYLKDCGLLSLDPVEINNVKITPREFTSAVLTPRLTYSPGDSDVSVMYNTVVGLKDGKEMRIAYHMWEGEDKENGFSSMARVTAFPAAIAARMIARGEIHHRGVVAPEECITGHLYDAFIRDLKARDITILETIWAPTPIM